MLDTNNSLILIIDIQEKLTAMLKGEKTQNMVCKAEKLAKAANIFNIKTIITEQYPKGLGETISEIKNNLSQDVQYFEKTDFSAISNEDIKNSIIATGKKQIVLCGIEAHICVYQTALSLINMGYSVHLLEDLCASRNDDEKKVALKTLQQKGATVTTLEISLFEWLKTSSHPNFKEIQALIK